MSVCNTTHGTDTISEMTIIQKPAKFILVFSCVRSCSNKFFINNQVDDKFPSTFTMNNISTVSYCPIVIQVFCFIC